MAFTGFMDYFYRANRTDQMTFAPLSTENDTDASTKVFALLNQRRALGKEEKRKELDK